MGQTLLGKCEANVEVTKIVTHPVGAGSRKALVPIDPYVKNADFLAEK